MPYSIAFFRNTPGTISLAPAWRRSAHACTAVLYSGEAVFVSQERRRLDAADGGLVRGLWSST